MKRRKRSKRRQVQLDGTYKTIHDSEYISNNLLEHLLSNAQKVKSLIPVMEAFKMHVGEANGRLALIFK